MIEKSSAIRAAEFGKLRGSGLDVRLDTSLELLLERAPPPQIPRVLATVVATAGSTYRKPGARMLIMADGSYLGLLSGGCLEADLKFHAQEVLAGGVARAVEYDMRGPDDILFGIGAGCEGAMRVLLEPAGPGTTAAAALTAAGRATAVGWAVGAGFGARVRRSPARHICCGGASPIRADPRRRAIARRKHIARHGLGRRRTAHPGVRPISLASPAFADLRSRTRCAARRQHRARFGLAGVGGRPSSELRRGCGLSGRRGQVVRTAPCCAPLSPSSTAMPPW